MADRIWPAFQRAAGSSAEIDYAQEVVGSRVLARVRDRVAGDEPPDVVILLNPEPFVAAGLADRAEPSLRDRYPSAWTSDGTLWPLYVEPTVAIYNRHYATPPTAWQALADGSCENRLALEQPWLMSTTGPALAELSSALPGDRWDDLVEQLAELRPRLVPDNERAVREVATGAAWAGLTNVRFARRVRVESPVRHAFLDPVPCVPVFGVLVRGGHNPTLARSFLEWLTSADGQRAVADAERVPSLPALGIPIVERLAAMPGVRPLFGTVPWVAASATWGERFRSMFGGSAEARM
jgi:ABC-type Fe3+ transport system substrate-binding protein